MAVASARPFNDDLGGITRSVNLLTNEACNLMGFVSRVFEEDQYFLSAYED